MARSSGFIDHLAEVIDGEGLLPAEGRLLIGVSGGADSVALLHGLHELNRQRGLCWNLHVAHLHHGIRGCEADADAAFVKDLADRLDLPVTVEKMDVPEIAQVRGLSVEEAAREVRYVFFERICLHTESRWIVLGHHADDNAETVLHRIVRGTGLRGLAGIAPVRRLSPASDIQVVRPLLKLHREDILDYLRETGLQWREDRSNAETSLTRNRIRHEILPLLESKVNKQVRDALIRLAEQARLTDSYLAETAQRTLETLVINRTDCDLAINLPALLKRSRVIRAELVRQAFLWLRVGEQQIDRRHVMAVLHLAEQGVNNKQINLPGKLTVARRYDRLVFSLPSGNVPSEEYLEISLKVPGRTILRRRGFWLDTQMMPLEPGLLDCVRVKNDPWTEYVDSDEVRYPLVARPRRPGDRFWPLGGPGSKKLADFFSECKVDARDRNRVAVVCDQLGPIWIMGMRIDDRVKLRRHTTNVLQLAASPLENRF